MENFMWVHFRLLIVIENYYYVDRIQKIMFVELVAHVVRSAQAAKPYT
jgi:hypothetical protein